MVHDVSDEIPKATLVKEDGYDVIETADELIMRARTQSRMFAR